MKTASYLSFFALALCWLGYFSPWLWPVPAALRLSAHDLVEWMTFMQSVRDGTYPVTRLDLLWPLAGIALLTAGVAALRNPTPNEPEPRELFRPSIRAWLKRYWPNLITALLALFAAYLILPAYPFVLTAYQDPELGPQFWLGVGTGIVAMLAAVFAAWRPAPARWLIPVVAVLALLAVFRAFNMTRQPIAEVLAQPAPPGYGVYLIAAGLAGLALAGLAGLRGAGRSGSPLIPDTPVPDHDGPAGRSG